MCDICESKAARIDTLANYFWDKSRETALAAYIERMSKAALSLEDVAESFRARCRCREERSAPGTARYDAPQFLSNWNW